jgi:predicted dithiol-disulfide oxidoreductase (DUF899 family)
MNLPEVVSPEVWAEARKNLLAKEKELTRQRDEVSAERRRLPMVKIQKPYEFAGPQGTVGLIDMFEGRRQLIMQHFMFDPDWEDGCPSCTGWADEISDGLLKHLHSRDTNFAAVARAPLAKLEGYKAKKGWSFPWYSSYGSDFNYDFHVTLDESVAPFEINYRTREELERPEHAKLHWIPQQEQPFENPGFSCFLRDGDSVFHTYFTTGRGAEWTGGTYAFLELTALGRQEEWEEPKGRVDNARDAMPSFED